MTIDWWTLGIQAANVAILVWLLQHFFWRPVAAMVEQRRVATQKALTDARATETKATAALADIAKTRAGFQQERDAILTAAHADADKATAASLEQVKRRVAAQETAGKTLAEREQVETEAAWSDRAGQLAVDIAGRLAARLHGSAVSTAFLDWLVEGIAALPDAARHAGATLTAVSATPLSPADQDAARARITAAFDAHPHIVFAADPALIEGFELHGPDFVVGNSWRADLVHIRATIGHDA